MKKLLFLLGCMLILCIPQAQPAERDIGYQVILPADNNAVVNTADCPAVFTAPEFVIKITDRNPGVQCEELTSASLSELGAESADQIKMIALPEADVNDLFFQDRNRQCKTRLVSSNAKVTPRVISTSNGGSGY